MQALVDFAVEHFGGLARDVQQRRASPSSFDRILDNDLADFEQVMGVNLYGVMVGTPARGAPHGASTAAASIINTASIAALTGGAGPIVYRVVEGGGRRSSAGRIAIDLADRTASA